MIKIEIPYIENKKTDYLDLVRNPVIQRIRPLLVSLRHLNNENIDTVKGEFNRYKHVTRKIVNNFIDGKKLDKNSFNKDNYKITIQNFISSVTKKQEYSKINFNGLIELLTFLIEPNSNELDKLLICDAENLIKINDYLLSTYSIDDDVNKFLLRMAFNYEEYEKDIAVHIKDFFRKGNFVKFCPYCNLNEVEYIPNVKVAGVASSHQLDHFFDKARFHLLSYSLFNLVPSDSNCNGPTNKGSITFTDEFHLNPYISGMHKKMKYKPIREGNNVVNIDIEILIPPTDPIYSKMLGSTGYIDERSNEGNINVFSLYSKYNVRTAKAEKILKKVNNADKGRKSINLFFQKMIGMNLNEHYLNWYEETLDTFFSENKFNENAYSKFNRDIHDYYYLQDKKPKNDYIRVLINE